MRPARCSLIDTKKRCFVASASSSAPSAWGISIFLFRAAMYVAAFINRVPACSLLSLFLTQVFGEYLYT